MKKLLYTIILTSFFFAFKNTANGQSLVKEEIAIVNSPKNSSRFIITNTKSKIIFYLKNGQGFILQGMDACNQLIYKKEYNYTTSINNSNQYQMQLASDSTFFLNIGSQLLYFKNSGELVWTKNFDKFYKFAILNRMIYGFSFGNSNPEKFLKLNLNGEEVNSEEYNLPMDYTVMEEIGIHNDTSFVAFGYHRYFSSEGCASCKDYLIFFDTLGTISKTITLPSNVYYGKTSLVTTSSSIYTLTESYDNRSPILIKYGSEGDSLNLFEYANSNLNLIAFQQLNSDELLSIFYSESSNEIIIYTMDKNLNVISERRLKDEPVFEYPEVYYHYTYINNRHYFLRNNRIFDSYYASSIIELNEDFIPELSCSNITSSILSSNIACTSIDTIRIKVTIPDTATNVNIFQLFISNPEFTLFDLGGSFSVLKNQSSDSTFTFSIPYTDIMIPNDPYKDGKIHCFKVYNQTSDTWCGTHIAAFVEKPQLRIIKSVDSVVCENAALEYRTALQNLYYSSVDLNIKTIYSLNGITMNPLSTKNPGYLKLTSWATEMTCPSDTVIDSIYIVPSHQFDIIAKKDTTVTCPNQYDIKVLSDSINYISYNWSFSPPEVEIIESGLDSIKLKFLSETNSQQVTFNLIDEYNCTSKSYASFNGNNYLDTRRGVQDKFLCEASFDKQNNPYLILKDIPDYADSILVFNSYYGKPIFRIKTSENTDTVKLGDTYTFPSDEDYYVNIRVKDSCGFTYLPNNGMYLIKLSLKEFFSLSWSYSQSETYYVYAGTSSENLDLLTSTTDRAIHINERNLIGLNDSIVIRVAGKIPDYNRCSDSLLWSDYLVLKKSDYNYVPFMIFGGGSWNVLNNSNCNAEDTSDTGILSYYTSSETIINELRYGILWLETKDSTDNNLIVGALREYGKKIYYRDLSIPADESNEEYLLYDFSVQKGDTIMHDALGNFYSVVLDIDSVIIQGDNMYRKKYTVKSNNYSDLNYIIEGIGSVKKGLLDHISNNPTCENSFGEFICYKENGIMKYLSPSFSDCMAGTLLTGITQHFNEADFEIYPNPFIKEIHIKNNVNQQDLTFKLIDIHGKTLIEKKISDDKFIVGLNISSGLYNALIVHKNGEVLFIKKVIKK